MKRQREEAGVDGQRPFKRPRPATDPWSKVFDGLADVLRKQEGEFGEDEKDAETAFMSPAQAILVQVATTDPFAEIQRRIDRLHQTFSSNWPEGKSPYYYQYVMLDHMIVMSMRWIVGSDAEFERLKPMLMKRLGMDRWLKSYDQIMPRQYGKSEGLAEAGGPLSMHLPMRIGIFAQGLRNSEQDLKMWKEAIKRRLPPGEEWRFHVDKANSYRFEVISLDPRMSGKRQFSTVTAYPSSGDSK